MNSEFRSKGASAGSCTVACRGMKRLGKRHPPSVSRQDWSLWQSQGSSTPDLGLRFHAPLYKSLRFAAHCCCPGTQGKKFLLSCLKSLLPLPHPTDSSFLFTIQFLQQNSPLDLGTHSQFHYTTKLSCCMKSFQGRNYI